jgi:hypothetical protein
MLDLPRTGVSPVDGIILVKLQNTGTLFDPASEIGICSWKSNVKYPSLADPQLVFVPPSW